MKYIQQQNHNLLSDMEMQRRENASLRMENSQLRGELASVSSNHGQSNHNAAPQPSGSFPARQQEERPALPPLRSLSGDVPTASESMTGVQYSEPPRIGGYRAPDGRY